VTDEYLTTAEAAVLLRYSQKTLRNQIAAGVFREGIHFVPKEGCQKRWKRSALVAWLEGTESSTISEEIPLAGQALRMPSR
jgi:hypothetical protein